MLTEFLALQYIDVGSDMPDFLVLSNPLEDDIFLQFLEKSAIKIEIPKS